MRNKEKHIASVKRWRKNNPAKAREIDRDCYARFKSKVMSHYGDRCVCCGEAEPAFLTIDHSNNDGANQRKKLVGNGRGRAFYSWIVKNGFPDDLQILCWNCNVGKKNNGGRCPHEDRLRLLMKRGG